MMNQEDLFYFTSGVYPGIESPLKTNHQEYSWTIREKIQTVIFLWKGGNQKEWIYKKAPENYLVKINLDAQSIVNDKKLKGKLKKTTQ